MPDVSDFERLKEMVSKLRAKERAASERRTLRGADATTRLAGVLSEINETVLPRRLVFQWDESDGVQLAVANRRLQGVLAPSIAPLDALAGKPLSDPEDDLSTGIRDALLALLEKAEGAAIRSVHLGDDDLGSDAGIAAEALVRHWGLETGGAAAVAPEDALPQFLAALSGTSTAWLSVEGEDVADQDGSEADLARLGDTAAYLLDAYLNGKDALFGGDDGPKAFAVASGDEGVFFADTGTQTVFVLTTPKHLATISGAWRASFG